MTPYAENKNALLYLTPPRTRKPLYVFTSILENDKKTRIYYTIHITFARALEILSAATLIRSSPRHMKNLVGITVTVNHIARPHKNNPLHPDFLARMVPDFQTVEYAYLCKIGHPFAFQEADVVSPKVFLRDSVFDVNNVFMTLDGFAPSVDNNKTSIVTYYMLEQHFWRPEAGK
jgi:hypothetical protein